jgi:TRAP-type C4-dicarboxylate transport system permease small subunit
MFKIIHGIAKKIFSITDLLAGVCFFALMLLVLANIIMRNAFGQPITGTIDLVELLTVTGLGFALAHCEMNNGNIAMSIVTDKLPKRMQKIIDIAICLIALIFWAVVVWRMFVFAEATLANGRVTPTAEIPLYPFIFILGINVICLCVALVFKLATSVIGTVESFRKSTPAGKEASQ